MSNTPDIIVYRGVRYRAEDARRLGLPTSGAVVTRNSREVPATTNAPAALITTETSSVSAPGDLSTSDESTSDESTSDESTSDESTSDKSTTMERPNNGASTADWTAYAIAQGQDAAALEGMKRDDIRDLFTDK